MPNMTLSIPEDLHTRMKEHQELNWSEVARQAIRKKVKDMETLNWMDEALKDIQLTKEDVENISRKIKKEIRKEFDEL